MRAGDGPQGGERTGARGAASSPLKITWRELGRRSRLRQGLARRLAPPRSATGALREPHAAYALERDAARSVVLARRDLGSVASAARTDPWAFGRAGRIELGARPH